MKNLPKKVHIKTKDIFDYQFSSFVKLKLSNQCKQHNVNKDHLTTEKELADLTLKLKNLIEQNLYHWEYNKEYSKRFNFDIPDSDFLYKKSYKNLNLEHYNFNKISYNAKEEHLTMDHLREIKQTGNFSVKSNIKGFPYVWHLSSLLISGKEVERQKFRTFLGFGFSAYNQFKYLFRYSKDSFYFVSFPNLIKDLYRSFKEIFGIIFGVKEMDKEDYNIQYKRRKDDIKRNNINQLKNNNKEFDFTIYHEEIRKIIENLYFDKDTIGFGLPIIRDNKNTYLYRKIFEFSGELKMTLDIQNNPSKRIVYDHLTPSNPSLKGVYEYYGPDLSFDAYEWGERYWDYVSDIDIDQHLSKKSKDFEVKDRDTIQSKNLFTPYKDQ